MQSIEFVAGTFRDESGSRIDVLGSPVVRRHQRCGSDTLRDSRCHVSFGGTPTKGKKKRTSAMFFNSESVGTAGLLRFFGTGRSLRTSRKRIDVSLSVWLRRERRKDMEVNTDAAEGR